MGVASRGSGWQQRSHPLPQVVRNKIGTHPDTLPTKIAERKTRSSTHSGTKDLEEDVRAVNLPHTHLMGVAVWIMRRARVAARTRAVR
jgi:hypothetical protein